MMSKNNKKSKIAKSKEVKIQEIVRSAQIRGVCDWLRSRGIRT